LPTGLEKVDTYTMKKYSQIDNYYDAESDIYWMGFKDAEEAYYKEAAPGVNVEYNKEGEKVGLEILNYSRFLEQSRTSLNVAGNSVFSRNYPDEQGFLYRGSSMLEPVGSSQSERLW